MRSKTAHNVKSSPSAKTGPATLASRGLAGSKLGTTPFPSGNAADIPSGLEAAMTRQGSSVTDMAKRLKQFNGPWKGLVGAADDDNSLM